MKKFIKNTANSIRTKAIRLAATRRSGEGYMDGSPAQADL